MAENNTLLEKLDGLVSRFEEVSTLITDPNVIADQKRYVKLTKEYKELNEIIKARKEYVQCLNGLEEARLMMAENDPEMKEIAREEAAACEARIPELEEEIKLLLVPADPQDDKNAIVEIRGGTGGDEAALFAGDLYRMYVKYCEMKGWKVALSSCSEGAAGGFKEIIFTVSGDKVYGTLKYESGVHRVQRVPATETQGRVHTSAATVAVLPEADEFDVEINEGEIGHVPFGWSRRTERKQSRIGRPPALRMEEPEYRRKRRNPDRMYRDTRPAEEQGTRPHAPAFVYI